jgi:L-seryl-tRNA(Ser) seleniumtransferase
VSDNPYRDLPSVDLLAERVNSHLPHALVVDVCRSALETARHDIAAGNRPDPEGAALSAVRALERAAGVQVINATGVLLHTNLGRAPWSENMANRARATALGYSNLEIDIDTGERSRRGSYVESLLRRLTGAQAGFVVNNNASALLIALAATSKGKGVPVARGELIEIGGSYRLPDVMDASGARLVEIGTTNRTRVGDYQVALQTHECGAVLKVHPSNYRVEGFTETARLEELADLASQHGLPLIDDVGSGLIDSEVSWLPDWLTGEPGVRQALRDGADLVTFSGDKLLGGPQAGILVGGGDLIGRIRSNPLARALRVDGVTYAALAATLEHHLAGEQWKIPFWKYALLDAEQLRARCEHVADRVGGNVFEGASAVGAGSAPEVEIPTPQVRLGDRQDIFHCLLSRDRPVLARRDAGDLIVDLRAVDPPDDDIIAAAIEKCL